MLDWLARHQRLDRPNARSSHAQPVPRGAGPALVVAIIGAWAITGTINAFEAALSIGALMLCALGWQDDRTPLSAGLRFAFQTAVVAALLPFLSLDWRLYPLILLAWLWMINLTNFMDGIDGITGAEMAFIGGGLLLVAGDALGVQAAALIGAALGFLIWNWAPARVFLGDSGSLPLGLISGGLLIALALRGELVASLLIPGSYLFDATLTLIQRALRGEVLWQAHRSHAYQRHALALGSHARAVRALMIVNLLLLGCAVLSLDHALAPFAMILGLGILTVHYGLVRRAEFRAKRSA